MAVLRGWDRQSAFDVMPTHLKPVLDREKFTRPLMEAEKDIFEAIVLVGDMNVKVSKNYMNDLHRARYQGSPHRSSMHGNAGVCAGYMKDWLLARGFRCAAPGNSKQHTWRGRQVFRRGHDIVNYEGQV